MLDRVYVCSICIFCLHRLHRDRVDARMDRCEAYIGDVASDEFRVALRQNLLDQVAFSLSNKNSTTVVFVFECL
uniref:Uncharacterized protein n=1 Tax=Peronospora matthiolae TaxID=2874970 RepID=A0AAV1UN98_9STRA